MQTNLLTKPSLYLFNFLLLLCLSITSLLAANQQNLAPNSKNIVLNYVTQARQANSFFEYKQANNFYKKALSADRNNSDILEEYLLFKVGQQELSAAIGLAQQIISKSPDHFLANLISTINSIKKGNLEEAINNLNKTNPDPDSLSGIILTLLKGGNYYRSDQSEKFVEIAEYLKDSIPEIYYNEIALLRLLNGNKEQAQQDLAYLNDNYPTVDGVMYYAKLLYQKDKAEGIFYFNEYLSDNFLTPKQTEKYLINQKPITLNYVFSDAIYRIALLMSNEINNTYLTSDRFILLNAALMLDQNNSLAKISLGSFYEGIGNYDLAIKTYKSIPKNNFYHRLISSRIVEIYNELGKAQESLKFLQSTVLIDKDNPVPFLEQGHIHHKNKDYKQAITSYTKALTISESNNYQLGIWLSHYFRGISYDKSGKWDQAEKDLLFASSINDQDPLLVNYLAYSWIDRNYNIEKSLSMLEKALDIAPDNANILDSYAWGLFKIKKYDKALRFAYQAASLNPYDATISNHLGDILATLGEPAKALSYWKSSLNLSSDPKEISAITKKINETTTSYVSASISSAFDNTSISSLIN
ncbi:tetratricopeptide-repeat protein [Candidatus Hepatincolaceae symbiont of Richtersius coronifer]